MTANKKTALVVAPVRGTYGKGELGSIARLHGLRFADLIDDFDPQRRDRGPPTVTELAAAERPSVATHIRGDLAAPLTHTATPLHASHPHRRQIELVHHAGNPQ